MKSVVKLPAAVQLILVVVAKLHYANQNFYESLMFCTIKSHEIYQCYSVYYKLEARQLRIEETTNITVTPSKYMVVQGRNSC